VAPWQHELVRRACDDLPAPLFRYVSQGARDGITTGEAEAAWAAHRFVPHVLRDVTTVDAAVRLLGTGFASPIGVAPTTLQRAVHPDGELAMAQACTDAGSLLVVSSNAGTPFADIGATGVGWWLQAYLPDDRTLAEPMLAAAVGAGALAVVLTVDTPVVGTKYDDGPSVWETIDPRILRVNFGPSYDDSAPGSEKATDLGPDDIGWLRETTGLPVVVKGVVRPDDARRAIRAGAAAVWVSNHGGRQLDRTVSTAVALPSVVSAVGGEAEIYVDGGVRTGADVLIGLGLGANAVFLGRLPLYALVGGADGVRSLHHELRLELAEAMRLSGCRTVADAPGITAPEA
jgi:4-hydroxymandelate oxidase